MNVNPFDLLETRLVSIESLLLEFEENYLRPQKSNPLDELPENLTRKQTAKILNICLSKVDQLANEGRLTKYRNGSVVRFKKSEVLNFYQSFQKYKRT